MSTELKKTKINGDRAFDIGVYIVAGIYALITLFPLLHIIACSFSQPTRIYAGSISFFPEGFTWKNYAKVFEESLMMKSYLNTLLYAALGTVCGLVLQMTAGYVLSRRDFYFKKVANFLFVATMFVNGGMIPTYLVVKGLGMLNTMWSMIIPGCMSVFNVIIIRTYISTSIPWELTESAMIDGANDIVLFVKIILPLSVPIIAIMVLYGIVGYWNSYFNALLYVTKEELFPLQMILRKILIQNNSSSSGIIVGQEEQALLAESLKYSTIIVSTLPILFIYPFFQKYFEQGLMVGGLKG